MKSEEEQTDSLVFKKETTRENPYYLDYAAIAGDLAALVKSVLATFAYKFFLPFIFVLVDVVKNMHLVGVDLFGHRSIWACARKSLGKEEDSRI